MKYVTLVLVQAVLFSLPALAEDGLELVNGRLIGGMVVLEDHHGAFVVRSSRTHMAQSVRRGLVHAVVMGGERTVVNPKRELTEEERSALPAVSWADSGELEDPLPEYAKQEWEEKPLYVWAKPGEGGKFAEARNWLVDGEPATSPPEDDSDLLLPEAQEPYEVHTLMANSVRAEYQSLECRHLTIERNAKLVSVAMTYHLGSIWIKPGGTNAFGYPVFKGSQHAVHRRIRPAVQEKGWRAGSLGWVPGVSGTPGTRKICVEKKAGASCQFDGRFWAGDEIYAQSGTMIVGPDSSVLWNVQSGRGTMNVAENAVLELRSGSKLGAAPRVSPRGGDLTINGTLLVGTPERPITKDATIYCRWNDEKGDGTKLRFTKDIIAKYFKHRFPDITYRGLTRHQGGFGLACDRSSTVRVHSADPNKARLVLAANTCLIDPSKRSVDSVRKERERNLIPEGDREVSAEGTHKGTSLLFQGDVVLRDTVLDYVRLDGIIADPSLRAKWNRITYGKHNAGDPDELFLSVNELCARVKVKMDWQKGVAVDRNHVGKVMMILDQIGVFVRVGGDDSMATCFEPSDGCIVTIERTPDGYVAFKGSNGKYVTNATGRGGRLYMQFISPAISKAEKFTLEHVDNDLWAIRAESNGLYVMSGGGSIRAERDSLSRAAKFRIIEPLKTKPAPGKTKEPLIVD